MLNMRANAPINRKNKRRHDGNIVAALAEHGGIWSGDLAFEVHRAMHALRPHKVIDDAERRPDQSADPHGPAQGDEDDEGHDRADERAQDRAPERTAAVAARLDTQTPDATMLSMQ